MQPLETVRVGIIGPSWWVNYWHLPAIQNHPQAIIAAVCGEKPRDETEVREKYGPQARYFTDRIRMLEEAALDGVIVCTPNDLHYPATMDALRRGIAVTCEKPVALTAAQAEEMAETARAKQVPAMTNFPYRDNPNVEMFRRMVAEGYIGTPLHISGVYNGGFGLSRPPGWRGSRERSGGGILGDLGSHLIDLVRFITGDAFASVCAHSLTLLRDETTETASPRPIRTEDARAAGRNDDSCAFLAEFKSGMQGILHTSWSEYQGAYRQHQEIEIAGTGGRLHFVSNHAGTFLRGLPKSANHWTTIPVMGVITPQSAPNDHPEDEDYFRPGRLTPTNTTYRWIEAIRNRQTEVSPSLEDGWYAQRVMDAVIEASAKRRWIDIP